MDYQHIIEQLIKRQPESHGSVGEVAKLLGVDRVTLWRLRQGTHEPSFGTVKRLLELQKQVLEARKR